MSAPSEEHRPAAHLYVDRLVWPVASAYVSDFVPVGDARTETEGHGDKRSVVVGVARRFHWQDLPGGIQAECLLDWHWIVHVADDRRSRLIAERRLFESIADRYDREIDWRRNSANGRNLLRLTGVPPGCTVLDFGCGPGLLHEAAAGVDIVGCDVSPAMRMRARAHGLSVVAPAELGAIESSVDGMIASYVLHLTVPPADLLAAARCVRPGGRIAANFHKARGLSEVKRTLSPTRGFGELVELRREHPLHGAVHAQLQ